MGKTETAISLMEQWAEDDAYGYDQSWRWGERGDYDCSAAVITAWERSGVPVKTQGATYTGNMRGVFLRCGFADVTSSVNLSSGRGLKRGDVLLNNAHHTAMYCGNGQEVEASINELGTATGGQPGDQTGREFLIRSYRNYPWDCVLRYTADDAGEVSGDDPEPVSSGLGPDVEILFPTVKNGSVGPAVAAVQAALHIRKFALGAPGIDGDFGPITETAVKNFQLASGLTADGIAGAETLRKLFGGDAV